MEGIRYDAIARGVVLDAIAGYKTHLSPRKGFSCAHRMLHQDESCSDYVQRMFNTENFMSALTLSRDRFRACATARQTLQARSQAGFRCIVIPCCLPL